MSSLFTFAGPVSTTHLLAEHRVPLADGELSLLEPDATLQGPGESDGKMGDAEERMPIMVLKVGSLAFPLFKGR